MATPWPEAPTTSPRQRPDRPIETVELRISVKADGDTYKRMKDAIPSAVVKRGGCEVKVEAEDPAELIEKAKVIMEKLKAIEVLRQS